MQPGRTGDSRLLKELRPDLVVAVSVGYPPVGVRWEQLEGLSLQDLLAETTQASAEAILASARELLLLEPLPIPGFHVGECFSAANSIGECAFSYDYSGETDGTSVSIYSAVYRSIAISESRITSALYDHVPCMAGSPCLPIENGRATMTDNHHVNSAHAVETRERLWQILQPIVQRLS